MLLTIEDWRKVSIQAMLLGETVNQKTQFTWPLSSSAEEVLELAARDNKKKSTIIPRHHLLLAIEELIGSLGGLPEEKISFFEIFLPPRQKSLGPIAYYELWNDHAFQVQLADTIW
ncbi:hypothetical protein Bca52824_006198 [Brassica carinata]|uniref:Uncharacterized protein n=1 Tax=Brassica carinata TaxID=52824 RepID=A0A8X8BHI5_BRACI|nr:hypothetical protein Bca52824_006198 [Brassica carinata]